jgi:hypothetical protein
MHKLTLSIDGRRPLEGLAAALLAVIVVAASANGQNFAAWSPAANAGPIVNSTSDDACPFVSNSGLSLYFRSNRPGGYGAFDIYVSQRASVNDPWGPPANLGPTINGSASEMCTAISNDGHWLYFVSNRPGGCGGQDIYVSYRRNERDDFAWETPKNLGCTVNSASLDQGPSFFEDPATGKKVLYFSSDRPGGAGGLEVYVSPLISEDAPGPPSLVVELNTSTSDYQPALRKDGLEIFFASDRPGGLGGFDVFASTRSSTSAPWSPPVNLGPLVNSVSTEARPSLSLDGTTLYFYSDRLGGLGGIDLYTATRTKLPDTGVPSGGTLTGTGTSALFDFTSSNASPFPSDAYTVADTAQKTGLRVNLPLPDCKVEPSTCAEIGLINELDGFSINPRIQVRFPGPIDVNTLRDGIYIVWLNDLTTEEYGLHPAGHITPINQMLYDPATNTAYAKPDEILSQHRRYALVVTDAVRDRAGAPVSADAAFRACVTQTDGYCGQLGPLVAQVSGLFAPRNIVAASVFTTLSATAWLEQARNALEKSSLDLQRTGSKSVFKISELASMTGQFQTTVDPAKLTSQPFPLYLLNGAGRVAFGSFLSPKFLNENHAIPAIPTGKAVELPTAVERIQFHVYLPESPAPPGGYPVVIAPGNTNGEAHWHAISYAGSFARHGLATIAINIFGAGQGPEGKLVIQEKTGTKVELPLGGRGVDLNGDKAIAGGEGCTLGVTTPVPVFTRDCYRQAALDLQQLARAIKAGIDVDGDGIVDLDRGRIYYHGLSLGGMYGPVFAAISPDVAAAVLDGGMGPITDSQRWNRTVGPVRDRRPSLLNKGATFDEDYVLRYQPVKIIDVPGALAIQEFYERYEWLIRPGDPTAYAPHLWSSTLPGAPLKRVLFQYAKGDLIVPNPAHTNLVRAANMRETTSFYRHDLAMKLFPALNPAGHYHSIPNITIFGLNTDPLAQYVIAMLAQEQAAGFLASDGTVIPDVNIWTKLWFGVELYEAPPKTLTEDLNR